MLLMAADMGVFYGIGENGPVANIYFWFRNVKEMELHDIRETFNTC